MYIAYLLTLTRRRSLMWEGEVFPIKYPLSHIMSPNLPNNCIIYLQILLNLSTVLGESEVGLIYGYVEIDMTWENSFMSLAYDTMVLK